MPTSNRPVQAIVADSISGPSPARADGTVAIAPDGAHACGVVHRDVKPDNVMLGDFGEVYLLD